MASELFHVTAHVPASDFSEVAVGDDVLGRNEAKGEVHASRAKAVDGGWQRELGVPAHALNAVEQAIFVGAAAEDLQRSVVEPLRQVRTSARSVARAARDELKQRALADRERGDGPRLEVAV